MDHGGILIPEKEFEYDPFEHILVREKIWNGLIYYLLHLISFPCFDATP